MSRELSREDARALIDRPGVSKLLRCLDGEGEETRIVGGAVRNALLRRPVHDIDLATTAEPRVTTVRARAAGFKVVPTGLSHGTVTVVVEGEPFEVTTLREDVSTDGRHATVRFGRDFAADAARRDFTINALSLDRAGEVRDTVGGLPDLQARQVRFIGDARERIREDYLRILRFFRFHAEYAEGAPDGPGLTAAIRESDGLAILSRERVRQELLKTLGARRAVDTVAAMREAGILGRLGGGAPEMGRLARAVGAGLGPVERLAALLVRVEEDGERLREGWRLSNPERDRLLLHARLVSALLSGTELLDRAGVRRLAAAHGAAALLETLLILSGEPRPTLTEDGQAQLSRFRTGADASPAFPLTGADLIRRGVPAGPEVGRLLAKARAAWLQLGCPPEPDLEELIRQAPPLGSGERS